jgi:hypothetical protein
LAIWRRLESDIKLAQGQAARESFMKRIAALLVLVGLAACGPAANGPVAANKSAPATAASGCAAAARSTWVAAEGNAFSAEAYTSGPTCQLAVATIVVRAAEGAAIMVEAAPTQHLFGLNEAKESGEMEAKLAEWLDQKSSPFATSDKLPAWAKGAEQPAAGEFPFYPDVDRDGYEQIRAAKAPLFCFVQGMESQACYALRDGQFDRVGVQTFPG